MDYGDAVPAERRVVGIDQQAGDPASLQFPGEQEPGRARTDDQHMSIGGVRGTNVFDGGVHSGSGP